MRPPFLRLFPSWKLGSVRNGAKDNKARLDGRHVLREHKRGDGLASAGC